MATCLACGANTFELSDLGEVHSAGVPITVVSKRLGHASIVLTADVYSHVNAEMQSDAAERGLALILGAS
jgi:integrase